MPRVTRQLDTSFLKRRRAPVRRPRRRHVLRFESLEERRLLTAAGDFDGDGYQDLIVGIPGEDYEAASGVVEDAGAIQVIYGSPGGLAATSDKPSVTLFQGSTPDPFDRFGFSVAVGNFDGDKYDDVAVGAPYADFNGMADAGVVRVFRGSSMGLLPAIVLNQDLPTITPVGKSSAAIGDRFGHALATGDFNGDEFADLAIGAPGDGKFTGTVTIFYGSELLIDTFGVFAPPPVSIIQDDLDSSDGNERGDNFGFSLAVGRLNADDRDDLVIGAPYDGVNGAEEAGAVHVAFGAEGGISFDGNQTWFEGATDANGDTLPGKPQKGDGFGFSLAVGNFDNYGLDDLAIGIPFQDIDYTDNDLVDLEDYDNNKDAGRVLILYSDDESLTASGSQLFDQDSFTLVLPSVDDGEVEDDVELGDMFGFSLAAGKFNEDNYVDLAIGAPYEDYLYSLLTFRKDSGVVHVLYGDVFGLTVIGDQLLTQVSGDLAGADLFGYSLAVGRFGSKDPDAPVDLVVGVPNAWVGQLKNAGAIDVFLSGEKLTYDSRWHQSTNVYVPDTPESQDGFGAALGGGSMVIAPVAVTGSLPVSPPVACDGSAPLTMQQMQNMEAYIRSQLDGNVVAYQAAIGQSAECGIADMHAFADGWATPATDSNGIPDLSAPEDMTADKKHNLGSISKMVMALTVLKLADLGELDLTAQYTSYLNPARFEPEDIHPTVKEVTVLELLTQTSQLEIENCCAGEVIELGGPSYVESQPRRTYNCFDSANADASTLPPSRCSRDYQNQNFGRLRLVIEGIRGTDVRAVEGIDVSDLTIDEYRELTRVEFEQEIHDIWLDAAGLDGVHCEPLFGNEDVKYFHVNNQGEFVVDAPDPSPSCSAGGWRFSARDVLKMLQLMSTGKTEDGQDFFPESNVDVVDPATMTVTTTNVLHNLLLDVTLADATGSPGSTALSWETPWESPLAPGIKNLGKDGAITGKGVRTYATLLPGGGYATLLSNTLDDGKWRGQEGVTGEIDPTIPGTCQHV